MLSRLDLWQRVRDFELDSSADAFPFSERLRRENGWSRQRVLGAINEYKKFIYLLCVSNSRLMPPEAVDQTWHLHLVYTRSYWTKLCDGVLGRPIRHEPVQSGEAQPNCFPAQYADAYQLYQNEFGYAPPPEIWPPVSERFVNPPTRQPVDRQGYWGCSG